MKPDLMQDQKIEAKNEQSLKTLNRAISFSENQFALIVVRCNYTQLRDRLAYQLQQQSDLSISTLHLPETAKTLYTTIQAAIVHREEAAQTANTLNQTLKTPQCLMLFGLESVTEIDEVLTATNLVRNQLRKQFSFPIVLWVNDEVLRKLKALALDLYSWAGMAEIGFEMPTSELVRSLKIHSDRLFGSILDLGDESFLANWKLKPPNNLLRQSELKYAIADLNDSDFSIQLDLQASLDFLLGQDAHARSEMETAHTLYERSLDFGSLAFLNTPPSLSSPQFLPIPYPERAACLLFYLGWWWRYYAVLQRSVYDTACEQAHDYFRRSLLLFAEENRQDLVARFIIAQAETLQKLKRWDALEEVAKQGLILHKLYKDSVRLARDYGFLAEVSLERKDWKLARKQVLTALEILEAVETELHMDGHPADPHLEQSLTLAHRYHSGWYWFLLARSEKELGNLDAAVYYLETARDLSHPESNPPLYIQILRKLRYFYFAKGEYRLAFRTRQARRLIEHQYGYRAFVGALRLQPQQYQAIAPFPLPPHIDQKLLLAQEISASGRQQDVKQIVDRLNYAKNKLVVIHGNSGVGKSSIVQAGLIPVLMDYAIDGRITIPILLEIYTDWQAALEQILTSVPQPAISGDPAAELPPTVLSRLSALTATHLRLPVLIFDQFEEFFFAYETVQSRLPFYHFLRDCLNLPFVKVVLSLREDYLHYLLEFQRLTNLEIIDNDILSKEILYPLGDFTPGAAKTVIQNLTSNAQFHLPDDLIDALVKDLAGEVGEVRPIELQVVGAQLQTEDIDTLAKYLEKGPKEKLVQRSLEDVVKDCGFENEELARIILFLLTNEKEARLLKNRDDLEADLIDLGMITQLADLDLVLEVLVGSGLLFLIPDSPADRYQIVHDYLVTFIRDQQIESVISLKTELENERNERKGLEKSVEILRQQRDQISLDIQSLTQELALTLSLFANTRNLQEPSESSENLKPDL